MLKVGKMPGEIKEFAVEEGSTVGDVLELANLDSDGFTIKVDYAEVDDDYVIKESDNLLLLTKKTKGNA